MKKIFICSPLRAPTSKGIKCNQLLAQKYAKEVYSKGCLPVFTHLYFDLFAPELKDDNPVQRKKIITMGFELLKDCQEMWVFGEVISNGMLQEIRFCKRNKIPIRYFFEFNCNSLYLKGKESILKRGEKRWLKKRK